MSPCRGRSCPVSQLPPGDWPLQEWARGTGTDGYEGAGRCRSRQSGGISSRTRPSRGDGWPQGLEEPRGFLTVRCGSNRQAGASGLSLLLSSPLPQALRAERDAPCPRRERHRRVGHPCTAGESLTERPEMAALAMAAATGGAGGAASPVGEVRVIC